MKMCQVKKKKFGFPKRFRVLKTPEFKRCYKKGTRAKGKFFILVLCNNSMNLTRLGLSISAKYGKAYKRNKFKRIIREAFRLIRPELEKGFDVIIVLPKTMKPEIPKLEEAKEEIKSLFQNAYKRLLKKNEIPKNN